MYKILLVWAIFLSACSPEVMETFSPTYNGSGCVPYTASALKINIKALSSGTSEAGVCCQSSWPVSCCFGGIAICANGNQSVRTCGCPDI